MLRVSRLERAIELAEVSFVMRKARFVCLFTDAVSTTRIWDEIGCFPRTAWGSSTGETGVKEASRELKSGTIRSSLLGEL